MPTSKVDLQAYLVWGQLVQTRRRNKLRRRRPVQDLKQDWNVVRGDAWPGGTVHREQTVLGNYGQLTYVKTKTVELTVRFITMLSLTTSAALTSGVPGYRNW
jgi:hypothetical protein